jgi:hypothetical protein
MIRRALHWALLFFMTGEIMALAVSSNVTLIYALGNGQNTYDQGAVVTLGAEYIEIINMYNQTIAYPWSSVVRVLS